MHSASHAVDDMMLLSEFVLLTDVENLCSVLVVLFPEQIKCAEILCDLQAIYVVDRKSVV